MNDEFGKSVLIYPTMKEVEEADQEQLCRWYRFLPSPGSAVAAREDFIQICDNRRKFEEVLEKESLIMNRIVERWKEGGRFTPELSKKIGWGT